MSWKEERKGKDGTSTQYAGWDVTPEAIEFGKLMIRLRARLGRTATDAEVLREAVRAGYRRVVPEGQQ